MVWSVVTLERCLGFLLGNTQPGGATSIWRIWNFQEHCGFNSGKFRPAKTKKKFQPSLKYDWDGSMISHIGMERSTTTLLSKLR